MLERTVDKDRALPGETKILRVLWSFLSRQCTLLTSLRHDNPWLQSG